MCSIVSKPIVGISSCYSIIAHHWQVIHTADVPAEMEQVADFCAKVANDFLNFGREFTILYLMEHAHA
jgi:hypothetical protein